MSSSYDSETQHLPQQNSEHEQLQVIMPPEVDHPQREMRISGCNPGEILPTTFHSVPGNMSTEERQFCRMDFK